VTAAAPPRAATFTTQVVDSCHILFSFFPLHISLFLVGWLVDGDRLFGLGKICSFLLVR